MKWKIQFIGQIRFMHYKIHFTFGVEILTLWYVSFFIWFRLDKFCFYFFFRVRKIRFVSVNFVSFRYISFCFGIFRFGFVSFRFDFCFGRFRFVSIWFLFRSVSFRISKFEELLPFTCPLYAICAQKKTRVTSPYFNGNWISGPILWNKNC